MDESNLPITLVLTAAVGVVSHLSYFRIGEHHMLGSAYVQLFTVACIVGTVALSNFSDSGVSDPSVFVTILSLASSWLFGVYSSLLVYRSFFHPLNRFPGPWLARITDLWLCSKLTQLNGHTVLHGLHQDHGRYVRIGSNTISITDPGIMQATYGTQATTTKSDFYDAAYPHHSMQTTRDKGLHDRRRRVWAPAFSDKALRKYESTVAELNEAVIQRIGKGGPTNVQLLFNLYSFDVMGRLAFGKDYGMTRSGERPLALDLLTEGMKLGGLRLPCWLIRILFAIPGAAAGHHKFLEYCTHELKCRVHKGKGTDNDITGWLLKAYGNEEHPEDDPLLQGDTRLIIVAGSDTTAAALTYLFYHLASDPSQQTKLRDELRPLACGKWSDRDINQVNYLNGAINEALRLHPPVPSGLMRKAPAEGLRIGEVIVPGNTTLCAPQYAMGRDERTYTNAKSFIPERWYSSPELVRHPDAFAPFSMGPFGCIGQNLARMEIRTLCTRILLKYNVAFAPGEDGSRILNNTIDHFTFSPGELELTFSPIDE